MMLRQYALPLLFLFSLQTITYSYSSSSFFASIAATIICSATTIHLPSFLLPSMKYGAI